MNKKILILVSIILAILAGVLFRVLVFSKEENKKSEKIENVYISDKVTDDCIEEKPEEVEETNSAEERVSPNSLLILKKYYKGCGHTINEYVELPAELVNMTITELEQQYKDWEVIGFSNSEITLYKQVDGECNEHFILKNEDNKISVYKLEKDGTEKLYNKTDISTEFLTETDLVKIENGFEVYGKEELNKVLEDFE